METMVPRSGSPCCGVLRSRFSIASANDVASAVSLDWLMGVLLPFSDWFSVRENGWDAYLNRSRKRRHQTEEHRQPLTSEKYFSTPLDERTMRAEIDAHLSARMRHARCQRAEGDAPGWRW